MAQDGPLAAFAWSARLQTQISILLSDRNKFAKKAALQMPTVFNAWIEARKRQELRGPVSVAGLQVSVFPQTYQRFLIHAQELEAPQLVVLFHPGLDVHYFTWYPCLRRVLQI
eukprot:s9070_g1.t1